MTDDFKIFPSGSKAGDTPAYPNIETMLAKAQRYEPFYDHVPGAYEKFKNGTTYHCGKESLNTNTQSKVKAPLLNKIARAGRS